VTLMKQSSYTMDMFAHVTHLWAANQFHLICKHRYSNRFPCVTSWLTNLKLRKVRGVHYLELENCRSRLHAYTGPEDPGSREMAKSFGEFGNTVCSMSAKLFHERKVGT